MNYYELLGVSSAATEEEIKRAYKVQMKKWHPDINKDEEAVSMSAKINEAKDTLLDAVKRREYDEFLNKKTTDTYERYSNVKKDKKEENINEEVYESRMVTKWEYLKDYLKNGGLNSFQKLRVRVLVYLESFLCFIIKSLILLISFLCFFLSGIIIAIFNYLYPIFILLGAFIIYLLASKGLDNTLKDHYSELMGVLTLIIIYISSFFMPFIGRKLLSPKVFDLLYNKLDIYLFKKAVGYK